MELRRPLIIRPPRNELYGTPTMHRDVGLMISGKGRAASSSRYGWAILDRILVLAGATLAFVTAASWFASFNWLFELLTHFRLHFTAAAALVIVFAVLRRRKLISAVAFLIVVANGSALLPYIVPSPDSAEASPVHVRLMVANVSFRNSRYRALREAIRQENPDVIGLTEATGAWIDELEELRGEYPYTVLRDQDGAYGLALYSRIPVRELDGSPLMHGGLQIAIAAEFELQETRVTLLLSHVRAPVSASMARMRNEQLEAIASLLSADANEEQILAGDLNTTQWSPLYGSLESRTGLVNAARGRGYVPTWPTWLPVGFLRIPIDHFLLSEGLRVQQVRTSSDVGSDHLPVIADVVLAGPRIADDI